MSPENETRLRDAFPALYQQDLPFGFECGDGWFDVLRDLSEKLQAAAEVGGLPQDSEDYPYATQVKHKFTALRWYGEHLTERMHMLIDEASRRARTFLSVYP